MTMNRTVNFLTWRSRVIRKNRAVTPTTASSIKTLSSRLVFFSAIRENHQTSSG